MCAAESGSSSIPCLVRQSSVGDYLLVHEQAPSLVREDPVFFPKGLVNRFFHKNALVSMGTGDSQQASSGCRLIPVKEGDHVPVYIRTDLFLSGQRISHEYPSGSTPVLKGYKGLSDHQVYIKAEIKAQDAQFVFLLVNDNPRVGFKVERIESFDFLDTLCPPQRKDVELLAEVEIVRRDWVAVTFARPAPSEVEAAAFIARHYVVAQRGHVPTYNVVAYKEVPKETGYARDYFLKVDIGAVTTSCLFVKLEADHYGGADNVTVADYDFSPNR